jgi:hypothetical protein
MQRRFLANPTPCGRSRREFLWQVGGGFASLALVDLLGQEGFFASSCRADDAPPTTSDEGPRTGQAGRSSYGVSLIARRIELEFCLVPGTLFTYWMVRNLHSKERPS